MDGQIRGMEGRKSGLKESGLGMVLDALHPAQQQLAREINPKVFSTREWKMRVRERNPFIADVLSKKKIFLAGDEDGLTALGRHKP